MKKIILTAMSLILISPVSESQLINKEPLSTRITGYDIDARLDPEEKTIECSMSAFWVNQTSETVPDIQLHLYMNAFKSNKSTFYKGTSESKDKTVYGRIDISSFTLADGTDILPLMTFIRPDDGNPNDSTVIQIILPEPAAPGDTVTVSIDFVTKLPSRIRRTGYNGDFFFVAQWFPKFGVYEPAGMRYRLTGGWNCHQFHDHSEFYSNHSVYNVKATVPDNFVTGSGGMVMDESDCSEDTAFKTVTWRAEDIVDFAWTAWPGYAVHTDQWNHVNITLLSPPEREDQVERQFTAVKNALDYFTENTGPYPWPHLTFVDPPAKGSGSGGMEYTTIFTSTSATGLPEYIHMPEMVTVHEFGHAYFMGILATNEFEDPWMDEGINSFYEARIMDHFWGENSGMLDHRFLKVSDKIIARSSYVYSPNRQVITNREYSWNYPAGTYSMMSYHKASVILFTMMGIVGEETTDNIFREYYKRWAFKHPAPQDFFNVVNDVVKQDHGDRFGQDMNWFFDQTLYGTGICDYKAAGISNVKQDTSQNFNPTTDSLYNCVVELQRLGEIMLPVEVLVHFDDGREVMQSWDGKDRYKSLSLPSNTMVKWVKIDPEYKILMDVNFVNNSYSDEPDRVPVRRFINKFMSFLQFFSASLIL
ncbi:MAG TPA: M1 family metallopeptidase [Bacteroidales bacterium]|nr:M1 family metallopeptidase [Bacteroidales bacterium]HPR10848.1 M1 family metallopeptidase [Bacteroidales bacterium]HRW84192.1 M1 family metallopeptidase [Bacteroidales bacterium]